VGSPALSVLYLIRHAQASFFEDDYDQLSPLGESQAAKLGDYLAGRGESFDAVYTGPAKRHRHTAEIVGERLKSAGVAWNEPRVLDGLNEHTADELLHDEGGDLAQSHTHLQDLFASYRTATEQNDIQRCFQQLFEAIVHLWINDSISSPRVEPFGLFQQRVRDSLETMTHGQPRGSRILAFSSVGPMSTLLQLTMGTPNDRAVELGWRLRNCSLNRLVFNDERITLDAFNSLDHLDDPKLITYR